MSASTTLDPVWEKKYRDGHRQRYPWDMVVSFIFRNAPSDRARGDVRILEVGFGAGSNLWFAAREGFAVGGIEGSESAVTSARERFESEGLEGDLRVGDFTTPLPFADASYDLVIDRGAITCCSFTAGQRTIAEIARVLRPGGAFLFTPYSKAHAAADLGEDMGDGLIADIRAGHLKGFGQVCFYGREDVDRALGSAWDIQTLEHATFENMLSDEATRAEWRVVATRA